MKEVRIKEGTRSKGGLNEMPRVPRPNPPEPQGGEKMSKERWAIPCPSEGLEAIAMMIRALERGKKRAREARCLNVIK